MSTRNEHKIRKKLHWDEKGALEGMPLYLLIMVIIAGLTIAIIVGWMILIDKADLDYINADVDGTGQKTMKADGNAHTIVVTAWDTDGTKLDGCTVLAEGAGIGAEAFIDNKDGTYTASVTPDLGPYNSGEITVTAKYTGNIPQTKTITIIVTK